MAFVFTVTRPCYECLCLETYDIYYLFRELNLSSSEVCPCSERGLEILPLPMNLQHLTPDTPHGVGLPTTRKLSLRVYLVHGKLWRTCLSWALLLSPWGKGRSSSQ